LLVLGRGLCWAGSACAGEEERGEGLGCQCCWARPRESEEEFLLFFFLKNLISYAIVKLISKSLEQIKL
jgi:hypothetical protein